MQELQENLRLSHLLLLMPLAKNLESLWQGLKPDPHVSHIASHGPGPGSGFGACKQLVAKLQPVALRKGALPRAKPPFGYCAGGYAAFESHECTREGVIVCYTPFAYAGGPDPCAGWSYDYQICGQIKCPANYPCEVDPCP